LVSRAIEQAQVKVEGFHFDARKNLVEYDNVINQQREIVYGLRRKVLESKNLKDEVLGKLGDAVDRVILISWPVDSGKPDIEKIIVSLLDIVPFDDASKQRVKTHLQKLDDKEKVKEFLVKVISDIYDSREKQMGDEVMRQVEKFAYLSSIDRHWIDHIDHLDGLREGVRLRAYGQKDPLVEFKNEAFGLFESLLERIDTELAGRIFRVGVTQAPRSVIPLESATTNVDTSDQTGLVDIASPELGAEMGQPAFANATAGKPAFAGVQESFSAKATEGRRKIGRNDPCWCGSGKKWKRCHYPNLG
jgi:preprotein translocase subunit SecA